MKNYFRKVKRSCENCSSRQHPIQQWREVLAAIRCSSRTGPAPARPPSSCTRGSGPAACTWRRTPRLPSEDQGWGSTVDWSIVTCVERCSDPPRLSLGSIGKQHQRMKATKATLVPTSRMKSSIDWKYQNQNPSQGGSSEGWPVPPPAEGCL